MQVLEKEFKPLLVPISRASGSYNCVLAWLLQWCSIRGTRSLVPSSPFRSAYGLNGALGE